MLEENKDIEKSETPPVPENPQKQQERPVEEAPKAEKSSGAEDPPKEQGTAEADTGKVKENQESAPAAEAPKAEEGAKKNKKINIMSLKEIDAKLKAVKEKMGNLKSRYAKQLLKQKDILDKAVKQ
jgi:hypothetical protein